MPVKRRLAKRNSLTDDNREALLYGPETVLLGGPGHYYRVGCNHVRNERPEVHAEAEARMLADWNRHGAELLQDWREPYPPWALGKFGEPHAL